MKMADKDNADNGRRVMEFYTGEHNPDAIDLADLLADLMHWAHKGQHDFDRALEIARDCRAKMEQFERDFGPSD
jgi:hypothetical protein